MGRVERKDFKGGREGGERVRMECSRRWWNVGGSKDARGALRYCRADDIADEFKVRRGDSIFSLPKFGGFTAGCAVKSFQKSLRSWVESCESTSM